MLYFSIPEYTAFVALIYFTECNLYLQDKVERVEEIG